MTGVLRKPKIQISIWIFEDPYFKLFPVTQVLKGRSHAQETPKEDQ